MQSTKITKSFINYKQLAVALSALALLFSGAFAQRDGDQVPKLRKAFVFSNGGPIHWHETVTRGTEIMNELAAGVNPDNHSFEVFVTAAVTDITEANLFDAEVMVLNNVSGIDRLLNTTEKDLVETFVAGGGGIHGWHATTDIGSRAGWPWFVNWISTNYIGSSGYGRPAPMFKDDAIAPEYEYILGHWDNRVDMIGEEWYQFNDPHPEDNENTIVLMRVDVDVVGSSQPSMPQIWINEEKEGRMWASGLGHFEALMARDDIVEMFYRGLVYASGGYDIAGCMVEGDPNYNPDATTECGVDCCEGISGINISNGQREGVDNLPGFKVRISLDGRHKVSVFNASGQQVAVETGSTPAEYDFSQSITQSGLYFVKATTVNGTKFSRVENF